jgi:thiol-disulfide isomerase/thioredoxin
MTAGLLVLLIVLALSTGVGLCWRAVNGRIRSTADDPEADPPRGQTGPATAPAPDPATTQVLAGLGVDPAAAPVTLVQFSSAFCQPCRATRQILGQVVTQLPIVRHVEVDAESHLDAVRALSILRTPTVLVVDRAGRVVRRASGQPRKADVLAAVAPYL